MPRSGSRVRVSFSAPQVSFPLTFFHALTSALHLGLAAPFSLHWRAGEDIKRRVSTSQTWVRVSFSAPQVSFPLTFFHALTSALHLGLAAPFSLHWRAGEDIKRRVSTSQTWVRVSFSAPQVSSPLTFFHALTSALHLGLAAPFSLHWRAGEDIKRRVSTSQTWVRVSFSAPQVSSPLTFFHALTSALHLGLAAPFSLHWRAGEDIKRRVSTSQTWVRVSFSAPQVSSPLTFFHALTSALHLGPAAPFRCIVKPKTGGLGLLLWGIKVIFEC